MNDISYYAISALAVLIILTLHEFAHGFVAYKLGDDTAKNLGRLSLNPLRHIDPIGALSMILFHFGWAKPVPINPLNFKKPKRDFALVALAGPLTNLICAFFSAFFVVLLESIFVDVSFKNEFLFLFVSNAINFLYIFHIINISLAIFNLIPIPPLDGSRLLGAVLPNKTYFAFMKYERIFYWGMVIWLLGGSVISRFLLSFAFVAKNPVLSTVATVISLPALLSYITNFISNAFFYLWELIPFFKV